MAGSGGESPSRDLMRTSRRRSLNLSRVDVIEHLVNSSVCHEIYSKIPRKILTLLDIKEAGSYNNSTEIDILSRCADTLKI